MVRIWSSGAKWRGHLSAGVNCVIAVFNEGKKNGEDRLIRGTFGAELALGVFRGGGGGGGLPLQREFTGLEMLHLALQLGCIGNAVVRAITKLAPRASLQVVALHSLHSLTKKQNGHF